MRKAKVRLEGHFSVHIVGVAMDCEDGDLLKKLCRFDSIWFDGPGFL